MTVSSADGTVLGYVEQEWVLYTPTLTVRDAEDNVVFNCVGPSAGPVWQTDSVKEFRVRFVISFCLLESYLKKVV